MSIQSQRRGSDPAAPARSGVLHSLVAGADLRHLSVALSVAAGEFACIALVLLALAGRGTVSADTATVWGATILVPLALVVGFLGAGVAACASRPAPAKAAAEARGLMAVS